MVAELHSLMGAFPYQREVERYTPMSRPLRMKPYLEERFEYEFFHIRPSIHINYYLDYSTTFLKLGLILSRGRYDGLLTWNHYYVPLLLPFRTRSKVLVDITDVERSITHNRLLKGMLVDLVEGVMDRIDLLISADYGHYQRLAPSTGGRVEYVPNGVDVEAFKPDPGAEKRYDVCYLGKVERQYRLEPVIEAISAASARALFVGSGSDMEYYRRYAKQRGAEITFAGAVPYAEVPGLLNSCRMGIVPPVESASLKLLEYLACGLPVASPGVLDPAVDEVVLHIRSGAAEEYRRAIEGVISMGEGEYRSVSRRCRQSALGFSIKEIGKRYCDVIEEVLG